MHAAPAAWNISPSLECCVAYQLKHTRMASRGIHPIFSWLVAALALAALALAALAHAALENAAVALAAPVLAALTLAALALAALALAAVALAPALVLVTVLVVKKSVLHAQNMQSRFCFPLPSNRFANILECRAVQVAKKKSKKSCLLHSCCRPRRCYSKSVRGKAVVLEGQYD